MIFTKIIFILQDAPIFEMQIKDHENTDLFVLLQVIKASPFLSWNLTVAYCMVQLYFFYSPNRLVM